MSPPRVSVTRRALLPDEQRVARYARTPELGPRILFLSGGSALRALARRLKNYTHNSVHLITPFDSGGSSARLRDSFGMLSVGDLRNRLMALADESSLGNPEIYALCSHRLSSCGADAALRSELQSMIDGEHQLVAAVPEPMRRIIRTHLGFLQADLPVDFDLRGASIGNLILAGGYLAHDRDIDSVIYSFSELVSVRGVVRPTVESDLHLAARLEDEEELVGQHRFTGKQEARIESPIQDLRLVRSLDDPQPASSRFPEKHERWFERAELICYPMGSFYSSVVANLLPRGVGQAIASARCPKIYLPNYGGDPEELGLSVGAAVERLVEYATRDGRGPGDTALVVRDVLDIVIIDRDHQAYERELELERIRALGVDVVELPLRSAVDPRHFDPELLSKILLSLC